MNTYVVIGSNCFTGSHVVDALLTSPRNRVIAVSRSAEYKNLFLPYKHRKDKNLHFHQIDMVNNFESLVRLLDEVRPQILINVAALSEVALSNDRPVEYFTINTLAVVKLCNYLRKCTYLERYVHFSSAEVFGSCDEPVSEETRFNPSTPYAVSKAAADMYLYNLISNFGFPATIIRSTNVYGKYQQLYKIIPRTIVYLKLGKTIELHGGGKAIKSFIHIRDVVRGLMLTIERDKSGPYHFTVRNDQSIMDIARYVCMLMGHSFAEKTRVVSERLGQDARYWLDCSKAEKTLGWSPNISFEQGVKEVINWIEDNWSAIQKEPLTYFHKI